MNIYLYIAILIAAATRVVLLITSDEITRPIRERVENRWPGSQLSYLVSCERCISMWSALLVLLLPDPVNYVLALSGAVICARWLAEKVNDRGE